MMYTLLLAGLAFRNYNYIAFELSKRPVSLKRGYILGCSTIRTAPHCGKILTKVSLNKSECDREAQQFWCDRSDVIQSIKIVNNLKNCRCG